MLAQGPGMAKGIFKLPVTIAPELVRERHYHRRARGYRLVEKLIHVVSVNVQGNAAAPQGLRLCAASHAGEFVGQEEHRITNHQFGVHHLVIGRVMNASDFGAERLPVKLDGF